VFTPDIPVHWIGQLSTRLGPAQALALVLAVGMVLEEWVSVVPWGSFRMSRFPSNQQKGI
jgi:hypothetical protein